VLANEERHKPLERGSSWHWPDKQMSDRARQLLNSVMQSEPQDASHTAKETWREARLLSNAFKSVDKKEPLAARDIIQLLTRQPQSLGKKVVSREQVERDMKHKNGDQLDELEAQASRSKSKRKKKIGASTSGGNDVFSRARTGHGGGDFGSELHALRDLRSVNTLGEGR